ncbi:hypothetical protein MMC20_006748 [Loxospora ochrophaea]|nr:hypothetical protein [Loxospora ochrophaea]
MLSGAERLPRTPQGHYPQNPDKISVSLSDNFSSQGSTNLDTPTKSEKGKRRTRRPGPGKSSDMIHVAQNTSSMTPVTPPRAGSIPVDTPLMPNGTRNPGTSASDSKGRKKGTNLQNQSRHVSSPATHINGTPRLEPRTRSATPGRTNGTPSQAYAGPTFLASPAPSALPIPKFFSKSLPDVSKNASLKSMIEENASENSSEKSEGSPTTQYSQRVGEHQIREESPLDMFFRADREEKARERASQSNSRLAGQESNDYGPTKPPGVRAANLTPQSMSRHVRHPTDSSINGLFPLEMEASDTIDSPSRLDRRTTPKQLVGSDRLPQELSSKDVQDEEQRKAKTLALKRLLRLQCAEPVTPSVLLEKETHSPLRVYVTVADRSQYWLMASTAIERFLLIAVQKLVDSSLLETNEFSESSLRFLAEERWPNMRQIVFDVYNSSYDARLAHLPDKNNIDVATVYFGQGEARATMASKGVRDRVNAEVAIAHNRAGRHDVPPFVADHTCGNVPIHLHLPNLSLQAQYFSHC